MDHQPPSPATEPTPPADTQVSGEARPPWTVKFVVPRPDDMPSERMKARAELVKAATGCGSCFY